MKTLIKVNAKLWFDKANGNTYHNVKVTILDSSNNLIDSFVSGMTYGYEDQYKQTAGDLLNKNSSILNDFKGTYLGSWRLMEDLKNRGILVTFSKEEVSKEKDLAF